MDTIIRYKTYRPCSDIYNQCTTMQLLKIYNLRYVRCRWQCKYKDINNYEVIFYLYSLYVTFNSYF